MEREKRWTSNITSIKQTVAKILSKSYFLAEDFGDPLTAKPICSIQELSRLTQIPTQVILESILENEIVFGQNGTKARLWVKEAVEKTSETNFANPRKAMANVSRPKRSKTMDQFESDIRDANKPPVVKRFQFLEANVTGRSTRRKILSRTRKRQIETAKLTLLPFDTDQNLKSVEELRIQKLSMRYIRESEKAREQTAPEIDLTNRQADLLRKLGLWGTRELFGRYEFRLSPDYYVLSSEQMSEIEEISRLVFAPGGYIDGGIKLFQGFSQNPEFADIFEALSTGIPKIEARILASTRLTAPFTARIDLITPKDGNVSFQIAEIEGDKTHAFGYTTITEQFRKLRLETPETVGLVSLLKTELTERGFDPKDPIILIVGRDENFYLKELEIFSLFAQEKNVNLITLPEEEVCLDFAGVGTKDGNIRTRNIVNLPSTYSARDGRSSTICTRLLGEFADGKINVLIPPARFLGSKALLALVDNGSANPRIEEMLSRYFDMPAIQRLRKFIPKTFLINSDNYEFAKDLVLAQGEKLVIKKTMSSGMAGVALPRDPNKQRFFLEEARTNPGTFIIQENIVQSRREFQYVNPRLPGILNYAPMYVRISPFATRRGVAVVGVTGRETPDVHGARDAIQIPIKIDRGDFK